VAVISVNASRADVHSSNLRDVTDG